MGFSDDTMKPALDTFQPDVTAALRYFHNL